MLVSIGDNCIDRYVGPLEVQHVGGNALNVAANFALRGLPATYAGVVGTDAGGELIVAALDAIGVNTAFVRRSAGSTGITEVELVQGDYRILREEYGVSDLVGWTPALRAYVQAHASQIHLTVSGRAAQLIEELEGIEVPLSVDLGHVSERSTLDRYERLLDRADSAFLSAGAQLGDDEVQQLLAALAHQGPRYAIATRGAVGASALWQGKLLSVPPLLRPAAVVDPLGAGDAFIAGFLSTAALQSRLTERLWCASRWSAEACGCIGAWCARDLPRAIEAPAPRL